MKETLIVGICQCTTAYHGRLCRYEGESLGRTFTIQEVVIPERDHREGIRLHRPHFFLDVHRDMGETYYQVSLHVVQFIPNRLGRQDRIFIGGGIGPLSLTRIKYWDRKKLPSSRDIIHGAEQLLGKLGEKRLDRWFETRR